MVVFLFVGKPAESQDVNSNGFLKLFEVFPAGKLPIIEPGPIKQGSLVNVVLLDCLHLYIY